MLYAWNWYGIVIAKLKNLKNEINTKSVTGMHISAILPFRQQIFLPPYSGLSDTDSLLLYPMVLLY